MAIEHKQTNQCCKKRTEKSFLIRGSSFYHLTEVIYFLLVTKGPFLVMFGSMTSTLTSRRRSTTLRSGRMTSGLSPTPSAEPPGLRSVEITKACYTSFISYVCFDVSLPYGQHYGKEIRNEVHRIFTNLQGFAFLTG